MKKAQKGSKAKEIREKRRAAEEERQKKIREQTRERVRRHREKAKESNFVTTDESPGFQNRTSRKRGTDKVRHALPATPRKKADIKNCDTESKDQETQTEYFDINKVSLHVSILYRHAVEAVDGVSSSEEEPNTIKEHIFVISDDPIQDHDSVHKVQELIHGYFQNDLGYQVEKVHEFTDGCAAQY